ncbi:hypothetical protein [Selenomonas ruminantium]|uniref:Uncharacterized protein n=1 Tax=Selenomonas ruminantium TaxID=971 RepID=A0A1H0PUQ8_SELRU|nr:hypothetical protein [Selenomonas ruminantium]SDP08887.1 hypothetical protein SAMN05216366_10625 [Selenomonas ruminantium]
MMRFYFIAAVLMGCLWLLSENGALQDIDCFWKTSSFIASEKQELRIELPVRLEPLSESDEGYTVCQADCDDMFVDLHSESLYLQEDRDRYMQEGPQKRVLKIMGNYGIENVSMTHQETAVVNHIPLRRFHFTGQQKGQDVEIEVVTIARKNLGWIFTFIYDAGDKEAERQVQKGIASLQYAERAK